jgi:DNA-binding IclR family transcriptional regulator
MSGPDVEILSALGHEQRHAIVVRLLAEPATQAELCEVLKLKSGSASKHLAILEGLGIVGRLHSHGAYGVQHAAPVLGLLERAATVADAAARSKAELSARRLAESRKLMMARGAEAGDVIGRVTDPTDDRSSLGHSRGGPRS